MTTITPETAALLDTLKAEAAAIGKALRLATYARPKLPLRGANRYGTLCAKIAAKAGTTSAEVNDLIIEELNEDLGLPRDFDRWAKAGTERPSNAEVDRILTEAGLRDPQAAQKAVAVITAKPAADKRKKAVRKAKAQAKNPTRTAGQAPDGTVEHFTCGTCGAGFSKVRTRGRKPTKCPPCRTTPEA